MTNSAVYTHYLNTGTTARKVPPSLQPEIRSDIAIFRYLSRFAHCHPAELIRDARLNERIQARRSSAINAYITQLMATDDAVIVTPRSVLRQPPTSIIDDGQRTYIRCGASNDKNSRHAEPKKNHDCNRCNDASNAAEYCCLLCGHSSCHLITLQTEALCAADNCS
jgi:hypothetical protein